MNKHLTRLLIVVLSCICLHSFGQKKNKSIRSGGLWLDDKGNHIQAHGGEYLKGGAVDHPAVRRLYQKIAMCLPDGESYVSGRAFRCLAELTGKGLREIIKKMPEPAWNYEP